ncbi:MAG TPA: hypothetical protein DFR83_17225 [Deltaproteobacteria bacterium]|nr:hypothetical protein [Deltaproteobacteria bacterium]
MPRKRKSYPELEALRHLLGKVPDHEVAARAGTSASIVGRYRRSLKVDAYDGYKFGNDTSDDDSTAAVADSVAEETQPAAAASVAGSAKATGTARGGASTAGRRSKIAPFSDQVGQISDKEVAGLAGVSTEAVRMYRRRRGIELNVAKEATLASKRPPSRRKSRLDPFYAQLGKVPDAEIAARAGVTPENVRAYRSRHGIKAEYRERRRMETRSRKQAVAVQAPTPTVETPKTPSRKRSSPVVAFKSVGASAQQAFSFNVDGSEETWVVVASDVAKAAVRAMAALEEISPGGRIASITYIGRAVS